MDIKKIRLLIALFLFVGFCGFAQVKQKIVSLAPSITDNLYLIEAQDLLIGCTSYCLNAVDDGREIVGTAVNVNVEKIASLQPSLVLSMQLTKPQDIEALERLGTKVVKFTTPASFDEICTQLIDLGSLIGKAEYALRIVKKEKEAVDKLKERAHQNAGVQKIFFQIGANPVYTVIPNTFMDDYISFSGGVNIAAGLTKGSVTREAVVLQNPDIIIIASMGGFDQEEKENWKNFKEINAVKSNRIFVIDSELACTPTPLNFRKSLEIIFGYLYENEY